MRERNIALKSAIFCAGLTQRLVAEKAEIPEAILSMIVNGKYIPDEQEKSRIASAIGRNEGELFKDCYGK